MMRSVSRRRRWIFWVLPAGGIVASAFLWAARPVAGVQGPMGRAFQLTYDVRLVALPPTARQVRIWVPLATSDRHQTIRRRVIRSPVSYHITRDPEYGNDVLFLRVTRPVPSDLALSIQYEATVHGENVLASVPAGHRPPAQGRSALDLQANRYMAITPGVRALARSVTDGAATPVQKARAIYRYVIERMTYEKQTPGWGQGDTVRACAVGAGNCTDFHSLFISLARAVQIPARFHIGLPLPKQAEGEIPGYHCWAEFYLDGVGWVPVDTSEAWKHREKMGYFFGTYDPNRLMLSRGRDLRLVPSPAQGPVNIFILPLVEVDGHSVEGDTVKTTFQFRELATSQGEHHA